MKKFLQKTLALLALCLVSVGAMANGSVNLKTSTTDGNIRVSYNTSYSNRIGTYGIIFMADGDITIETTDGSDIASIEYTLDNAVGFSCRTNWLNLTPNVGSLSLNESTMKLNWTAGGASVTSLKLANAGYCTFSITRVTVTTASAGPAATAGDLTYTSANGNANGKVVPVLTGDVLTFEDNVTWDESKRIQFYDNIGSNYFKVPTISNNTLTFNFGNYTTKSSAYYLEIPAGALTVDNVYNQNPIVIYYTVDEVAGDLNIVSENGGKEFNTGMLTGDVLTFDDNVTVDAEAGITLDGNAITPSVSGNRVIFTYSELANGTHTLNIPAGVLHVGNIYNQSAVSYTYTVTSPGAVATFDMSAAGYATLCIDKAFTVPTGYTAYVAGKLEGGVPVLVEGGEIVLTEITDVPAYTPVILESNNKGVAAPGVELFAPASAPVAPVVNYLIGNASNTAQTMNAGGMADRGFGDYDFYNDAYQYGTIGACQLYQLAKENDKVGFYRQEGGEGASIECAAHKAILAVPNAVAAASNGRLLFPGQDDVTGINAIATENAEVIYNLQGQRVNAAKAGVYVKNGKKFIVK